MANFPGLILTDAGRNLQAKAQIGQPLQFTRVALGQGNAPESIEALTRLVDEQKSLSIQSFENLGDGTSKIRAILTNEGLATGFFVREIGVYARDPDSLTETLYSYSNSAGQSDFLPAEGGATLVEQIFDLVTVIGNAQNVTAVIDDYITIATKADIEEIRPYVLPAGGLVGQLVRKSSNAEGDVGWFDPEEGLSVRVHSISETRTAVGTQDVFNLVETRTTGLAVYVEGSRLSSTQWTALNATQVHLATAVPDGTQVEFINNEEVGTVSLSRVSLSGPSLVYPDTSNTYTVTDYDAFSRYAVSTDLGTASINGDTITLVIPAGAADGAANLTVSRNEGTTTVQIAVGAQSIARPDVLNPVDGAAAVSLQPTATTSTFRTYPSAMDTHNSTDWQIATDSGFTNIVWESLGDAVNLEAINVPSGILALTTQYYVRARHHGASLGASDWSPVVEFTTTNQYIPAPGITSPADNATDIPEQPVLEATAFATDPAGSDNHLATSWQVRNGTTVVWESLNDTSHLNAITVPAGVLQVGTTYSLRARHHGSSLPASDWSPVVTFNTAAQFAPQSGNAGVPFGGGYFVSRMLDENGAEYALIVSPKAEGELQAARTTAQAELEATTIGGHSDWRIADDDEHYACFWNLRPGTYYQLSGGGISDRIIPPTTQAFNQAGVDQTSVEAFKSGGSEAFATSEYWSELFNSTTSSNFSYLGGAGGSTSLGSYYYARGVRRHYI